MSAFTRNRGAAAVATTLLTASALLVPASTATALPTEGATLKLTSGDLQVEVSEDFPQVISYTDRRTGSSIAGRTEPLSTIILNGTAYDVEAETSRVGRSAVSYDLSFPQLAGVSMEASLRLKGRVTTFNIDAVDDTEAFRVGTIDIPGHDLISVGSDQPGATVTTAAISADRTKDGDTTTAVTADTPADEAPRGSAYAVVNTDRLAAAIESNSTYDQQEDAGSDNRRIWRQSTKQGGETKVGLWSGQWTYRADGAPFTEELPWAKVVVTPDANDDRTVDWQDGAVALRGIVAAPRGAEATPDRVVQRIPYNFGSMATHPFLRTLDDTKRISLATDGLGQLAILKGYQSEGHDSAHPDYGGNYNKRAGGLDALNTLLKKGERYGADFGVHVNATEAYPVANSFSDDLVDPDAKGWDWLDQSYYIDQRRDLISGDVAERFAQLREETHDNLELLYLDVYYSYGWKQERLAQELDDQGWQISTEWSYHFDRQSLWSHWANDESYGGQTNKGLNSQLIRFVRNTQKDTWNPDPILGNTELRDFEGWTAEVDWNWFYDNIWQRNLPTKFLQQEEILDWEPHEIRFTGDVRATNDGSDLAGRKVFVGDAKVLDGDTYLLPWKSDQAGVKGPEKLYHYNADGGTTSWKLTDDWAKTRRLAQYRLTDQGRELVRTIAVTDGTVSIPADAGTAYVLDRQPGSSHAKQTDPTWGESSHVDDPGFNAGDLRAWETTGDAFVERNAKGQYEAILRPGGTSSIGQKLTGLTPGTWAANVQVEVEPGKTRRTTLSVTSAGRTTHTYLDRSTAPNYLNADEKLTTYAQTAEVRFEVPRGTRSATLRIAAEAGDAQVRLDNLRVLKTDGPRSTGPGVVIHEDFEDVTQGWYPFVKGDTGGVAGPRTHIAQRHAPYTQAGWNGKLVDDVIDGEESLKSHEERVGLVYRTLPQSVRFEQGHRYRVSFDHQSGRSGHYQWVTGYDRIADGQPVSTEVTRTPLPEQRTTLRHTEEFVAGSCGDYWVGLRNLVGGGGDESDLVIDDFTVEDLGVVDDEPACGSMDVEPASDQFPAGQATTVTTAFTSTEQQAANDVELALSVPEGWQVDATSPSSFATVVPGATVETTWAVTPPADATGDGHELAGTVTYDIGGSPRSISASTQVGLAPAGHIPQSQLRIHDVSSENAGSGAARVLDGNPTTGWHTRIDPPASFPHHVTLDLGGTYDVTGLDYQIRVGNRAFKDYEVYVSADDTVWGEPAASGTFAGVATVQHVEIPAVRGRYVKLVGLTPINNNMFGGADELNVWGTPTPTA
ncbi:endo-alpha-N-acetylgalactosaminidase family protein [Isoptericola hypogeus]|uniref:Endo-alpha-N-acetylgalactosaminidase family protein n=1 Tax=Isoptericola hypogeus TaxID=300179 RepID=A0ABN2JGQ2_9MICO